MKVETMKIVSNCVTAVVTTVVLGEMFGGVISRPVAMWRIRYNSENITDLIMVMNQRICNLEFAKEQKKLE